MVKKAYILVLAVLFIVLFLACSKKPPAPEYRLVKPVHINIKWTELPEGESFPWENEDGFFPSSDHSYGFDRHTLPGDEKEDSIVHVSVAQKGSVLTSLEKKDIVQNKDGFVTLKINQDYGGSQLPVEYYYYLCNPESSYPYDMIDFIDNSKNEQTYKFTSYEEDVKKIAICKENNGIVQIVQELHIRTYPWRKYDFLPVYYSNGGKPDKENALIASYEFWESSREIYKQALVAPAINVDSVLELKKKDRLYTRVRGTYSTEFNNINYCTPRGDIFNADFTIQKEIANKGLPRRAILQLNLPTRRFWPLKANNSGNIVICGSPDEMPLKNRDYSIVSLNDDCKVPSARVRLGNDDKLYLVTYDNNVNDPNFNFEPQLTPATEFNFSNFSCAGIAEGSDYKQEYYVGEISNGLYAETTVINSRSSLTLLPWSGEFTSFIASRELGKILGLGYVYEDLPGLPGTGDNNPKSEQNNIMFFNFKLGGYKLRQRNVSVEDVSPTGMGYDNQWDCLQRKSQEKSCSSQGWLFE
jgi:hypothetical protein